MTLESKSNLFYGQTGLNSMKILFFKSNAYKILLKDQDVLKIFEFDQSQLLETSSMSPSLNAIMLIVYTCSRLIYYNKAFRNLKRSNDMIFQAYKYVKKIELNIH